MERSVRLAVTPMQYRLKYLAWLLPVATLGLTLSASGRDTVQRGQTVSSPAQAQAAPPPQGQGGPGRSSGWFEWWKDELVVKELQLSPAKARRIDQIFTDRTKRVASIADELPVEQKKLEQLVAERVVDESTFALQVGRVVYLRSRRDESRQVMLYRMYLELTPEQYTKLRGIFERSRAQRGRGPHQ